MENTTQGRKLTAEEIKQKAYTLAFERAKKLFPENATYQDICSAAFCAGSVFTLEEYAAQEKQEQKNPDDLSDEKLGKKWLSDKIKEHEQREPDGWVRGPVRISNEDYKSYPNDWKTNWAPIWFSPHQ